MGQMWLRDTFDMLYSSSDIYIHIKKSWILYEDVMTKLCPLKRYIEVQAVLLQGVNLLGQ